MELITLIALFVLLILWVCLAIGAGMHFEELERKRTKESDNNDSKTRSTTNGS